MFSRIFLIFFLCVIVLSSYMVTPYLFPSIPVNKLWGGIRSPPLRYTYLCSIVFAAVAFIYILYLFCRYMSSSTEFLFSLSCFLVFSALWTPVMFLALKQMNPPGIWYYISFFILGCVAFFAFCLLSVVLTASVPLKWVALIASGYLFFHTFVFDFLLYPHFLMSVEGTHSR